MSSFHDYWYTPSEENLKKQEAAHREWLAREEEKKALGNENKQIMEVLRTYKFACSDEVCEQLLTAGEYRTAVSFPGTLQKEWNYKLLVFLHVRDYTPAPEEEHKNNVYPDMRIVSLSISRARFVEFSRDKEKMKTFLSSYTS